MKKLLLTILAVVTAFLLPTLTACKNDMSEEFILKAKILSVGDKIEVDVMESDYAFGVYLVITSNQTEFFNVSNDVISKNELKVESVIEITYGGQVMMSLPPQIVAKKIKVLYE